MKLDEAIDSPQDWPRLGDSLMSNFDHEVDEKIAAELRAVQAVANYPGWDFHATCWWDGARGMYMAAVRRYRSLRATFAAPTPRELMEEISAEFGHG
jgi:hypothetical protein